jgi:clan AA aspartic protease
LQEFLARLCYFSYFCLNFNIKEKKMGLVYADIELINSGDLEMARRYIIGDDEVKRITLNMLVDTGAYNLCINETIQQQLDLPFVEKRKAQLANGHIEEYDVVGPIVLKFKNRRTVCNAMVLQGDSEPLLGAIPLEDMDVLIHPARQELIVNPDHPYYAQMTLKGLRK